jgi:D-psicose/D-tagatose/L-ribulose 3-epimerase
MDFGAITFIWKNPFTGADLGLVDRVAGLGFDVIEVAVEDVGLFDPEALHEALDAAGIRAVLTGFCTPTRDVSSEDEAVRTAGVDYVKGCVDLAVKAGSPIVAGPLNHAVYSARMLPPDERSREFDRAARGLREAAEYAGERGISLALEPLNRWETDMLNTAAQGVAMCDAVGLDNVGLLLDTFHMNIEEQHVGDAIRGAGDRVFHVHGSENDRGVPGSGHVPWAEVAQALHDISYDGAVCLESFEPGMAAACSIWRSFFDDPDEFARAGLAHLRATFG